jgi:hypothetical protein
MENVNKDLIRELLSTDQLVCISLYMPTHRSHPENQQDPIRFKNLLRQIQESLLEFLSQEEAAAYLEPFESLAADNNFWNHTGDGLAVFATENYFKTVALQEKVEELIIVSDSFHTKPLRMYMQSLDNFYVLGLQLHTIKLFKGNRFGISEVNLPEDFPTTIEEALGEELTDAHLTVASYNGPGGSDMVHGHGGKKDEMDKDAERFFRVIADHVHEKITKNSSWPLMLAALPEHHNLFHRVSKTPSLMEKGITIDPSSVSPDKLAQMAWEVMEPSFQKRIEEINARFSLARAKEKGSDNLEEVVNATMEGKVDTLLIEAGKILPGRLGDLLSGDNKEMDLNHPGVDDILDDLGEEVIRFGGEVLVVPSDNMPTDTGVAAIYRY